MERGSAFDLMPDEGASALAESDPYSTNLYVGNLAIGVDEDVSRLLSRVQGSALHRVGCLRCLIALVEACAHPASCRAVWDAAPAKPMTRMRYGTACTGSWSIHAPWCIDMHMSNVAVGMDIHLSSMPPPACMGVCKVCPVRQLPDTDSM